MKPCRAYSPASRTSKSVRSSRESGLKGRAVLAVWSGGGASDGVELADGRGRVVDAGESVEVAGVALRRDLLIAEEEGDLSLARTLSRQLNHEIEQADRELP